MWLVVALVLLLGPAAQALAQPDHHAQHASPSRDQYASGARGLSAQELDDLVAGRGMGLARAAELNGYPGPRHVLAAAADPQLALTQDQRVRVQRVVDAMEQEARQLGARVIAEEQALEAAFRTGTITEAELATRVDHLAAVQGALRQVHLRAHLATRAVLTEAQVTRYNELRGYATASPAHP